MQQHFSSPMQNSLSLSPSLYLRSASTFIPTLSVPFLQSPAWKHTDLMNSWLRFCVKRKHFISNWPNKLHNNDVDCNFPFVRLLFVLAPALGLLKLAALQFGWLSKVIACLACVCFAIDGRNRCEFCVDKFEFACSSVPSKLDRCAESATSWQHAIFLIIATGRDCNRTQSSHL